MSSASKASRGRFVVLGMVLFLCVIGGLLLEHDRFPTSSEIDAVFLEVESEIDRQKVVRDLVGILSRLKNADSNDDDRRTAAFVARYGEAYARTRNPALLDALDSLPVGESVFGDVVCALIKSVATQESARTFWVRRRYRIRKLRYCADVIGVEDVERIADEYPGHDI